MKYQFALLGGSGHIGTALATRLLKQGHSMLIVGHDAKKAGDWQQQGAAFETADILDSEQLRGLFSQAERVFILNPPAPPSTDTDVIERKQIRSVLAALQSLDIKKIVAASTYGAQPGEHLYDLGVLYELEQGLKELAVPLAIVRSAYYMSNFDQVIPAVQQKQELVTLFPADFKLPMVAPADIGHFAADLLTGDRTGLFNIEGPQPYSNQDAADAFSQLIGKNVKVVSLPPADWKDFLMKGGFSEATANSFINMVKLTLEQPSSADDPLHGPTSLQQYLQKALAGPAD